MRPSPEGRKKTRLPTDNGPMIPGRRDSRSGFPYMSAMTQSLNGSITQFLDGVPFEEIDQLNDQDYYHHELEHKGSRLVELLDHEAVEIFGGVEFFLDQVFVVG